MFDIEMADKYNIVEIEKRIRALIATKGNALLFAASLPQEEGELDTTKNDSIKRDLNSIREFIRKSHELVKDRESFYYMDFSKFNADVSFSSNKLYSDNELYTRSSSDENIFIDFESYFMDTVKNVLSMEQEMRDGVKTLFVGDNPDLKLLLVQDLVTPDTLVVNGLSTEDVWLPFLPSVRRLKIVNLSLTQANIHIGEYIFSITDLCLETSYFSKYMQHALNDAMCLESLSVRLQYASDNSIQCIIDSLRARRRKDRSPIKAFRFIEYYDYNTKYGSTMMLELLHELSYHPLEVLGLSIPECEDIEILHFVAQLVGKLDNLKILEITSYSIDAKDVISYLSGKIDKLEGLRIEDRSSKDVLPYLSLPVITRLKHLKRLYLGNQNVDPHRLQCLEDNRKNEALSSELMDTLPNNTLVNSNILKIVGMNNVDNTLKKIMDVVYRNDNDGGCDFTSNIEVSVAYRRMIGHMINELHKDDEPVIEKKSDMSLSDVTSQ